MGGNDISVDEDMYDIVPPGFRIKHTDIKIEKSEIMKAHSVFQRIQEYVQANHPQGVQSVCFIH